MKIKQAMSIISPKSNLRTCKSEKAVRGPNAEFKAAIYSTLNRATFTVGRQQKLRWC